MGTNPIHRSRGLIPMLVLAAGGTLLAAPPVLAQDREHEAERGEHVREIMEHLRHGVEALVEIGRPDLGAKLEEIEQELRREIERASDRRGERDLTEREIVQRRVRLLRMAFEQVARAGHEEVAGRIEHAVHAYELMLEGARGDEAREARQSAPKRDEEIELIGFAAHVCEEQDRMEMARLLREQRDRLWPGWRERGERDRAEREAERGPDRERAMARERLEMMHLAMRALRESGRVEAVELLERAIRAIEVNLEGREDHEAREIRAAAPDPGQQIELLNHAADLWAEFGHETKAQRLKSYAQEMLVALRERQRRVAHARAQDDPERARRDRLERQIEQLQDRLARMERMLDELRGDRER